MERKTIANTFMFLSVGDFQLQGDVAEEESDPTVVGRSAGAEAALVEETTQFVDVAKSSKVEFSDSSTQPAMADAMQKAQLTSFLSRPVRVASVNWTSSDAKGLKFEINPWEDFFSDSHILNKLQNFAFIRCNLHLKIVLNASPFQYGAMRVVYTPLAALLPTQLANVEQELMQVSQRPGAWIDPSNCEGSEMVLPFIWPTNFLRITQDIDFTNMGKLSFYVYYPLSSANGISTNTVALQVYAWAENVELSGTTLGQALQGDEYGGSGPISAPASAVASVARAAKRIPIIGKFAAATEIGATAISKLASMFGYTNVPVLDEAKPFRQSPFPQLASTEIGYPVEKLTLDAKNELSIDPSIVGAQEEDELAITSIVSRESYLTSASWSMTSTVDTNLFSVKVHPWLAIQATTSNQPMLQMTPTAMVMGLFSHWRGDLIFKFHFVASPFHKGRVRICYDPVNGDLQTAGDVGSVLQNTIVDLGVEREVEVRVPYQQQFNWMRYENTTPYWSTDATSLLHTDGHDNGILSLKVLTLLTSPVATSSVGIIVSVRAAENFEVANPRPINPLYSPFNLQGDTYDTTIGSTSGEEDNLYRVNFGEKVTSLRPLLHRSSYVDTLVLDNSASGTYANIMQYDMPRKIPFFGYDTHGTSTAKGLLVTGSDFNFQFGNATAVTYLQRAFLGMRGAIHWHYNITNNSLITNATLARLNTVTTSPSQVVNTFSGTTKSSKHRLSYYPQSGNAGMAATNAVQQSVLSISVPNATQYKFQGTNAVDVLSQTSPLFPDGSDLEYTRCEVLTPPLTDAGASLFVHRYAAAGTDFGLYFFLHVPRWVVYPSLPLPGSV